MFARAQLVVLALAGIYLGGISKPSTMSTQMANSLLQPTQPPSKLAPTLSVLVPTRSFQAIPVTRSPLLSMCPRQFNIPSVVHRVN
jgi:hypothetical protein